MRLIDVLYFLNFEEGKPLRRTKPLVEFTGPLLANTKYAILSHCWGPPEEEVQFTDVEELQNMDTEELQNTDRDMLKLRKRKGYQKILGSCKQAHSNNLRWVWVDTCCIDKCSSSELSEAINSMYHWYAKSERCYAYLHDVRTLEFPKKQKESWMAFDGWPMWFSRGWTLQELVAPDDVHFFNQAWDHIGTKRTLTGELSRITKIPDCILTDGLSSWRLRPSVAQIMSWAANRRTTRIEDRAYSLLGMLGVHMPMLYGEGKHAFRRLQEEIIRRLNDQTIFAWGWSVKTGWSKNFLADDPSCFSDCDKVIAMKRDEFVGILSKEIPQEELNKFPPEHLRTFTLSNDGIQIWLPIIPCRKSAWLYKARLPCRLLDNSSPISITLGCFDSNYFRYFGDFDADSFAQVQFQQVFLPYQENVEKDDFTFHLELRTLSYAGFAQPALFPPRVRLSGTSITLSGASDCAVLVYCRPDGIYLTVVLRHCLGEHSVQVICEESESGWLESARRAYQRAKDETLAEAFQMSKSWSSATSPEHSQLLKRVHIPRSIHDVRLVYSRALQPGSCTVIADVVDCAGCCKSAWEVLDGKFVTLSHIPGFMRDAVSSHRCDPYEFHVNSHCTRFLSTNVDSTIEPGDYGRMMWNGPFEREGNIFDLAATLGLNMPHRCVELGSGDKGAYPQDDFVELTGRTGDRVRTLALRNATVWSLPSTEDIYSLIAAFSVHLSGRRLVTTVIRCSESYYREGSDRHYGKGWLELTWSVRTNNQVLGNSNWEKHHTPSRLYTLMTPLAWHRENAHENTRSQFESINLHVDKLLTPDGNKGEREAAVRFFADIFGGKSLENLVGDISFFSELASLVAASKADKSTHDNSGRSVEDVNEPTRSYPILRRIQVSTANRRLPVTRGEVDSVRDSRIQVIKGTLVQDSTRAAVKGATNLASTRGTAIRQTSEELRSKGFGPQLLRLIGTIYMKSEDILTFNPGSDSDAPEEDFTAVYPAELKSCLRNLLDRVYKFRSYLQTETNDDEVQRALTEDIAGTILLLCWQGIRCEVKQVLKKVVKAIVNDKLVEDQVRKARAKHLRNVGEMFVQNATDHAPEYRSYPMQRAFTDAEAGISKYDLLLAARKVRSELPQPSESSCQDSVANAQDGSMCP